MPVYEFRCRDCAELSEFMVSGSADSGTLSCPACGSKNLERLISAPVLLKSGAATPGATCCGREERCEASPCSTGEQCWRH